MAGTLMGEFGAVSYAIVGILYAVLCALLLAKWRGRPEGGYLIAAGLVSIIWAGAVAAQSINASVPMSAVFTLEILRGGVWLSFLTVLLSSIGVSRHVVRSVNLVWVGILALVVWCWIDQQFFDGTVHVKSVAIPGGLIISLLGLILIGQLYRNSTVGLRRGLRSLVLGLGGLFAFDLLVYSQGMLFGVLDAPSWTARGAVNILFIPLIAFAARRNQDWDRNIVVSRKVVFYTTSLIVVGIYLLLMSLGGYALVTYGGTWGEAAQVIFIVGAVLTLAAILSSRTARSRLKVFLSKHFFQNKYDYREEWLRLISTLTDFEDSSTRQIIVQAMAQIVDSPGGLLWILDEGAKSYELRAAYSCPELTPSLPADCEMVRFIKYQGWLIDLQEYETDPDNYGGLQLPSWLADNRDAWLVVPLVLRNQLLGLVLLLKAPGPPALNYEDRDLLKTVGSHLAVHLAQEKTDILLSEAQQFEAYNRLTAFLMHDLNNLIAQQSLIIRNAEKHRRNPDFVDDAMQTIANSVDRMRRVMSQLKRSETDSQAKLAELRFILSAAVDRCNGNDPRPALEFDGLDAKLSVDAERFTMVLVHLIKNAQDATSVDGSVTVKAQQAGGRITIAISDTGCGMTSEYIRNHLFKPFDSTKGSQGMGIGAYQARKFILGLGGDLSVDSTVSKGTTVVLAFPIT